MDLILIRHPRTVAPDGTCYGSLDVEAHPERLASDAARLKPLIPPDARLICSPLRRARDLAAHFGEPETDPRLVEMNFGDWENRLWTDLPRDEIDGWAADFMHYTPPGGESVRAMAQRTLDWWRSVEDEAGTLAVVGHGGPWRLLAAHLTGTPLEHALRFEIEWGGRAHFRVTSQGAQLRGWNLF